jgi:hypothetical protein
MSTKKRAGERTRTADLLITSLIPRILARPTASGDSAYLRGILLLWRGSLSTAYRSVPARLRYVSPSNIGGLQRSAADQRTTRVR